MLLTPIIEQIERRDLFSIPNYIPNLPDPELTSRGTYVIRGTSRSDLISVDRLTVIPDALPGIREIYFLGHFEELPDGTAYNRQLIYNMSLDAQGRNSYLQEFLTTAKEVLERGTDRKMMLVRLNDVAYTFMIDQQWNGFNTRILVEGAGGNDNMQVGVNTDRRVTISGSAGDDILVAGQSPTTLMGGSGNDLMSGLFSRSGIYAEGTGGDDRIIGSNYSDTLLGGSGNDLIDGADVFRTPGVPLPNRVVSPLPIGNPGNGFPVPSSPVNTQGVLDIIDGGSGTDVARRDRVDRYLSVERLVTDLVV